MKWLNMDLNNFLLWAVIVLACFTIFRTVRDPFTNSRGWIIVSLGILIISVFALWLLPNYAGYLATGLWVIFGIIPTAGFRHSEELFARGDYEGAHRIKSNLRWLHPYRDWPLQETQYLAFQNAVQGDLPKAKEMLAKFKVDNPTALLEKEWFFFYISRDWAGLIQWWQNPLNTKQAEKDPTIIAQYIRALGECGELNTMLQMFEKYKRTLSRIPNIYAFSFLYIFALCGLIEFTKHIMSSGILKGLDEEMQVIWLAIAQCAANNYEVGQDLVTPLLKSKDIMVRIPAEKCAAGLVAIANTLLSSESKQILARLEQEWSIMHQIGLTTISN